MVAGLEVGGELGGLPDDLQRVLHAVRVHQQDALHVVCVARLGVELDGALHEFSSLPGVREDVTDIVLNVKQIALKMEGEGMKRLQLSATGPGEVKAGDIAVSGDIEVMNKDLVICHLDDGADLYVELTVNTGKGYVSADKNKPEDAPIGLIPIDAIYSPVKRVAYEVQPTREGQVLDYDKLTMKVETDGSVTPEDAIAFAECRPFAMYW